MAGKDLLGIVVGKAVARLSGAQYQGRKKIRVGPKFYNLSWTDRKADEDRGFWRSLIPRLTSQGYEAGPVTYNETTGRKTFDTPGTGSVSWPRGRRRSRR